MRPEVGQLERSLAALTIGIVQAREARVRALADGRTGEWEQQLHVSVSGLAGRVWGFTDKPVTWEFPLLYAPLQRPVPFQTPHFTYGFELTGSIGEPVVFTAHVLAWNITHSGWYVGATMRFGVCAPNAVGTSRSPYAGIAHLSFQGYGGATEAGEYADYTGD